MKSEERHEIETNELAKILTGGSGKIAPYVSYIVYGLLAVAAVWAIVRLTSGSMNTKELQAWDAYTIPTLPGRFDSDRVKAAATQYAGEPVGELAQIAWADSQLASGCRNFFTDKKRALEELDAALSEYKGLSSSATDKNLRARAQLGVAKTLEAKGEVKEAIAAYEKVTGAFSEMADARVEQLQEMNSADYADWLASAEGSRRPTDFGRGSRPDFAADPLALPGDDPAVGGVDGGEDFLEMLRRFQESAPDAGESSGRYDEGDESTDIELPGGAVPPVLIDPLAAPTTDDTDSSDEGAAEEPPSDEGDTEMVEETTEEEETESGSP